MRIHEKLKAVRLLKGWSQEKMAEELGYSIGGYAKIERGENDINMTKLGKIAETMGVDLESLLGLNETNVFQVAENCHYEKTYTFPHGVIVLTEAECAHELEKAKLEIEYLKQQNADLRAMINLLKSDGK